MRQCRCEFHIVHFGNCLKLFRSTVAVVGFSFGLHFGRAGWLEVGKALPPLSAGLTISVYLSLPLSFSSSRHDDRHERASSTGESQSQSQRVGSMFMAHVGRVAWLIVVAVQWLRALSFSLPIPLPLFHSHYLSIFHSLLLSSIRPRTVCMRR